VARLSIVIPVLNKLHKLEDTLVSILENRPGNCQIIVVLNEPYADPYQLGDEVCFVEASRDANLIESIRCGLQKSRSPIVHILACGMEVSPGWTNKALRHFIDPEVAGVAPLVLQRLNREKTVSAGVGYQASGKARRLGFDKSPDEALLEKDPIFGADILAAFYRRSALEAVNGLNPAIGGHLCGVDLAVAFHFNGFRCISEPECKMFVDREEAVCGYRLGGGRAAERLYWAWAHRFGWLKAFSSHAALVTEECLESVVRPSTLLRLSGRAWEALRFTSHRRFERTTVRPVTVGAHSISAPHFATKQHPQSASCSDKQ
jgi:hypothetical protein